MKLTYEEHKLIGNALILINHKVHTSDYMDKYPTKILMRKSPINKVEQINIILKYLMEKIFSIDYPKKVRSYKNVLDIYYGNLEKEPIRGFQKNDKQKKQKSNVPIFSRNSVTL